MPVAFPLLSIRSHEPSLSKYEITFFLHPMSHSPVGVEEATFNVPHRSRQSRMPPRILPFTTKVFLPSHTAPPVYIRRPPCRAFGLFLFFLSSALFAFWLRSSVVSVLFSLISEMFLRGTNFDYTYFCTWQTVFGACHQAVCTVSLALHYRLVTRITFFFHHAPWLV